MSHTLKKRIFLKMAALALFVLCGISMTGFVQSAQAQVQVQEKGESSRESAGPTIGTHHIIGQVGGAPMPPVAKGFRAPDAEEDGAATQGGVGGPLRDKRRYSMPLGRPIPPVGTTTGGDSAGVEDGSEGEDVSGGTEGYVGDLPVDQRHYETNVPPEAPQPVCHFEPWVGQKMSRDILRAVKGSGRSYRILAPGASMTMDYSAERINFEVDAKGMISRVWCG